MSARLIELGSPDSESELAVIKSLLDDAGIPFFVQNDNFGSLLAGPRIALYNRKRVFVHEVDEHAARGLLGPPAGARADRHERRPGHRYSTLDKLRMVLEFLLFGWFLPGRREPRRPELRLIRGRGRRDDSGQAAGREPADAPDRSAW